MEVLEPDVGFIKELKRRGGDTMKKCYQCATCSVICPISPDNKPFPRKEMISASWGLKDRLVSNLDIWLCHQCGDCSEKCPRGARPGDTLGAIRNFAIEHYAKPKWLAKAVNNPSKLPLLLLLPVVLFLIMGYVVAPILWFVLGPILGGIFKFDYHETHFIDFSPSLDIHGNIAHGQFFSSWLVDLTFVPAMTFAVVVFALALKNFIKDMHNSAVAQGKVKVTNFSWTDYLKALGKVAVPILRHDKFKECDANKERATPHMMVLFGFIGLFIVTGIFFAVLYGSALLLGYEHAWHSPYSQWLPVKWLANIAGVTLVVGALAMIKNRLGKDETVVKSSYQDWALIGLVLVLGVTGLGTEMTRIAAQVDGMGATSGMAWISYLTYFVHLVFVFVLFVYVPFSKLAHLVYRTAALAYAEYAGRDN